MLYGPVVLMNRQPNFIDSQNVIKLGSFLLTDYLLEIHNQ